MTVAHPNLAHEGKRTDPADATVPRQLGTPVTSPSGFRADVPLVAPPPPAATRLGNGVRSVPIIHSAWRTPRRPGRRCGSIRSTCSAFGRTRQCE